MFIKPEWLETFAPLIKIIRNNGGEARFVGGCVRDTILNRRVNDFDLATTLLPNQIVNALEGRNIKTIPTGLKHGTITALFANLSVEITTLRTDITCDGRHAEVAFTNQWEKDAARRDFTFNALYLDLEGKIYDYFSGLEDLKSCRLNFVGDADKRIQEDYLRILRAFRFHANLCDTPIDHAILESCKEYKNCLNNLSGERIQVEMFKLLQYPKALNTLITMQNCEILKEILNTEVNFDSINIQRSELISDYIVKLALLLKNVNDDTSVILKWLFNRWKFSRAVYKKLQILTINNLFENTKKNLVEFGKENTLEILQINYTMNKINDREFLELKNEILNIEIPEFPILGKDIKELGFSGEIIGEILSQLHSEWERSDYTTNRRGLLELIKGLN